MHFFYVDESYDQIKFVISAIRVAIEQWKGVLREIKGFRSNLRSNWGIKLKSELHAHSFVRHCSDGVSTRNLSIADRRKIFEQTIDFIAALPVEIINVCLPLQNFGNRSNEAHYQAVDRLFNRIQTNVSRLQPQSHALVIFDKGKEQQITKLSRRLAVFNYIPSQFGTWSDGARAKNIATDRIIEDPVFRESRDSYFLQLADFVAFALLKREVPPSKFVQQWGYHTLFDKLRPVLCLAASQYDRYGIVRA
jgi:uncharacterized protein DUF3800